MSLDSIAFRAESTSDPTSPHLKSSFRPLSQATMVQIENFRQKCQDAVQVVQREREVVAVQHLQLKSALKSTVTRIKRISFHTLSYCQVFTSDEDNFNIVLGTHEEPVNYIGRISEPKLSLAKLRKLPRLSLSSCEFNVLSLFQMIDCEQVGYYPLAKLEFFRSVVLTEHDHDLKLAIYLKFFEGFDVKTLHPDVLEKLNQAKLELFLTFPQEFQDTVCQKISERIGRQDDEMIDFGWKIFQADPSDEMIWEVIYDESSISFNIEHLMNLIDEEAYPLVKAEYLNAMILDPACNIRIKIQGFIHLFECQMSQLELTEYELKRYSEIRNDLFFRMPKDFQEDVKYRIWSSTGKPLDKGDDYGKDYFLANPFCPYVYRAVYLAGVRPRYIPTNSEETVEQSIENIRAYINQFMLCQPKRAKLYIFQALELCTFARDINPEVLLQFFFIYLDRDTLSQIFYIIQESNPGFTFIQAQELVKANPLDFRVVAAVRQLKDLFLSELTTK